LLLNLHPKLWTVILEKRIVFGELGQLGYLVQKLAGVEMKLDRVPRLRLNKMVELVQDPKGTQKLAIYNLVQVLVHVCWKTVALLVM
jgi:hypothetical protein